MDPTTYKHPRTLTEAFGPYASGPIDDGYDPMPLADKIVLWTCGAGFAALAVFLILGWI